MSRRVVTIQRSCELFEISQLARFSMCTFNLYIKLSNLIVDLAMEPLSISLITCLLTKMAKCRRACRSSFLSSLCAWVLFRNGRVEK